MPKSIWKFGKNWAYITPSGKRGLAKTRTEAAKKAGTKKRKSSTKAKTKRRTRAKRKVTRAGRTVRRVARRRRKHSSRRRAISVNLASLGAVGYAAYKIFGGISLSNLGVNTFGQVGENFKQNWKEIVGMSIGVAILKMVGGRYAPRVGVPGALSVKAF